MDNPLPSSPTPSSLNTTPSTIFELPPYEAESPAVGTCFDNRLGEPLSATLEMDQPAAADAFSPFELPPALYEDYPGTAYDHTAPAEFVNPADLQNERDSFDPSIPGSPVSTRLFERSPSPTPEAPILPPIPHANCPSVQWYRRFHVNHNYAIDDATISIIAIRTEGILGSLGSPSDPPAAIYAKYIAFMMADHPNTIVNTVASMVMYLFFHTEGTLWITRRRGSTSRLRSFRILNGRGDELYNALKGHLPSGMTSLEFFAAIQRWRKTGAAYACFGHRLGLGALVHAWVLLLSSS
jgi:hypothetical protein